jgi:6-phosphofructokinase 1
MRASMMGALAVELLCEGKSNRIVAYKDGKYTDFDIDEGLAMQKSIDPSMFETSKLLETR